MKILSWNCRGLGTPEAVPVLRNLVRFHHPDVVFLIEMLATKTHVEKVRRRLGFESALSVDKVGRSGGLALLWRSGISCDIISYSRHFINAEMVDLEQGRWRLTGFYGIAERGRRRESWQMLRQLAGMSPLPWCVLGNFNDILDSGDKSGRSPHPPWLMRGFHEAVHDCNLSDVPLEGYPYT